MALTRVTSGLSDLVDETSGKEIIVVPTHVDQFTSIRTKYEPFLNMGFKEQHTFASSVTEVFSPVDINLFLQSTSQYEGHGNYTMATGRFISLLIQNSFNSGHNNFVLDVQNLKPLDCLGSELVGYKKNQLRLTTIGDVGCDCGMLVNHVQLTFPSVLDRCGKYANHSQFIIGTARDACGVEADNSHFTINTVEDFCGLRAKRSIFKVARAESICGSYAYKSTFVIGSGSGECGEQAERCVFKTSNNDQFSRFKQYVSQGHGNKLYLMKIDGSEEEVLL